jgi:hypothetical protein
MTAPSDTSDPEYSSGVEPFMLCSCYIMGAHPGMLCLAMFARSCCNYRTNTHKLSHLVARTHTRSPAHTQEGDTALSLALIQSTTNGRLDVVQLLLDSKADIHAASKVAPRCLLVFIPPG